MDYRAIREALHAQPFRPFRMRLNDGREYDVPHPDFVAIGAHGRHIVHINAARDDAITILEPLLIATIEHIQATPPAGNGTVGGGSGSQP